MLDLTRVRTLIDQAMPELRAIRHDLHMNPELAFEEHRTSGVVQRELKNLGITFKADLAEGTGVVAHLPATEGTHTRAIGLRADMDALPIPEQTGLPYASCTPGKMHACGHDGHTTILLGVARVLSKLPRPRPVTLVFQPAEEGGGGGELLCNEGLIEGSIIGPPIEKMFGLHGWPEFSLGTIGTRPGPLLASTDELKVTVRGVQSHAAYPHYSRDPIVAASQCVLAMQTVISRNVSPLDSVVVSVCQFHGGTARNVIPDHVKFTATLRCLKPQTRALAKQRLTQVVEGTCAAAGCSAEITWEDGYPVTYNDPGLTDWFFKLTDAALGAERVVRVEHPTMGGEDFSYYAQRVPSVFFCLGLKRPNQERHPTLHQPDFDFNDEAMPLGIELFCRLATAD